MTGRVDRRIKMPARDRLLSLFSYDRGRLFWRARPESEFPSQRVARMWNTSRAGKRAGGRRGDGYRDIGINGKKYLEHRIIAAMFFDEIGHKEVDHINGDKSDNRIENLRLVTHQQNAINRPGKANGLPKHVSFSRREGKFKVMVRAYGKRHHIGTFATVEDARCAAQSARELLHREFARHD